MLELRTNKGCYFTSDDFEIGYDYNNAGYNSCNVFYAGEIKKLEIKLEDNIPYLYGTAIIKITNSISPFVVNVYQVNFKTKKQFEVKISDLDECTTINLNDIEFISYNFIEFEEVRDNDEDNSICTGEYGKNLWNIGF